MRKIPERIEAKRAEIASAALKLFFENGYEATSIRMIQRSIHKEASLFYYYFPSKDAVFEAAIEIFFKDYETSLRELVESGMDAPNCELTKLFNFIHAETQKFREQYLNQLHWSILGAIREHTLRTSRKYVRDILDNYVQKGLMKVPEVGLDAASNVLAYGICGTILYQEGETAIAQRDDICRIMSLTLGTTNL